jgi:hypothetical protein
LVFVAGIACSAGNQGLRRMDKLPTSAVLSASAGIPVF